MDEVKDLYIYNPLAKEIHTKAFGNHFSFKPGAIKRMRGEIGDFLAREKAYMGLVGLSDAFDDPSYKESEEGKSELEAAKRKAVENRSRFLQAQVNNLQISLRQDLDAKNNKSETMANATDGDLSAMEELRDLQIQKKDESKIRLERARQLERQLKANSDALANKKD
jgi:hypothetical protein